MQLGMQGQGCMASELYNAKDFKLNFVPQNCEKLCLIIIHEKSDFIANYKNKHKSVKR